MTINGNIFASLIVMMTCLLAVVTWITLARRLRGTTLVPAIAWGALATAGVVGLAFATLGGQLPVGSVERVNVRYLTAALTICPCMAVLGARRPHHLAWQWIVLTLLAVLALPVAEAYIVQRGGAVSVHGARAFFLAALILCGVCNYLPTRYGASAIAVGMSQALLVSEHIPGWYRAAGPWDEVVAAGMIGLAMLLGWMTHAHRGEGTADDRTWRDFRDAFGALWALRMQDRWNTYARQYVWHAHLTWHRFVPTATEGKVTSDDRASQIVELSVDARRSWWSLLRRFVDRTWLREGDELGDETGAHVY